MRRGSFILFVIYLVIFFFRDNILGFFNGILSVDPTIVGLYFNFILFFIFGFTMAYSLGVKRRQFDGATCYGVTAMFFLIGLFPILSTHFNIAFLWNILAPLRELSTICQIGFGFASGLLLTPKFFR